MVVNMLLIHMSAEYNLVIGEAFFDKSDAQFMSKLRRDLTWRKALDDMKRLNAVRLAVSFFCCLHLLRGIFWIAILAIGKDRIVGLVRVLNVANQFIEPHPLGKNLGYCHVFSHSRMRRRTC